METLNVTPIRNYTVRFVAMIKGNINRQMLFNKVLKYV